MKQQVPNKGRQKRISKFLSYVLRHHPESIGIKLDKAGWTDVSGLLEAAERGGFPISLDELKAVVRENDKQRFSLSEDCTKIRANQGHTIPVDLGYKPTIPPKVLYHGTAQKNLNSIRKTGLTRGSRHHVHLCADPEAAEKVGRRYGKPIVLEIEAGKMYADGHKFYLSPNGVWLTEFVPPHYLSLHKE